MSVRKNPMLSRTVNSSPTTGRFLALKKKGGSFNGVRVEK